MGKISREEHIQRHKELHKALDELVGDHIRITGRLPSDTTVMDLMAWSNSQTMNPTGES